MALEIIKYLALLAIAYPIIKGLLSIIKLAKGIKNGHNF